MLIKSSLKELELGQWYWVDEKEDWSLSLLCVYEIWEDHVVFKELGSPEYPKVVMPKDLFETRCELAVNWKEFLNKRIEDVEQELDVLIEKTFEEALHLQFVDFKTSEKKSVWSKTLHPVPDELVPKVQELIKKLQAEAKNEKREPSFDKIETMLKLLEKFRGQLGFSRSIKFDHLNQSVWDIAFTPLTRKP